MEKRKRKELNLKEKNNLNKLMENKNNNYVPLFFHSSIKFHIYLYMYMYLYYGRFKTMMVMTLLVLKNFADPWRL